MAEPLSPEELERFSLEDRLEYLTKRVVTLTTTKDLLIEAVKSVHALLTGERVRNTVERAVVIQEAAGILGTAIRAEMEAEQRSQSET